MNIIRAQARALFSLRSTWVYLGLVFFGLTAWGWVYPAIAGNFSGDSRLGISGVLGAVPLATLVMVVGAAMTANGEAARGMLPWMYLYSRHRNRVWFVTAQTALLLVVFLIAGVLGVALSIAWVELAGPGVDFGGGWANEVTRGEFLFAVVQWSFCVVLAVALADALRSSAIAVVIILADLLIVESLLGMVQSDIADAMITWLPMANLFHVAHGFMVTDEARPVWLSAVTLVGYVVVALGAAMVVAMRRAVR